MYVEFYKEWAQVFGADNVLVLKSEEYYKDRLNILNQIFTFIGLSKHYLPP